MNGAGTEGKKSKSAMLHRRLFNLSSASERDRMVRFPRREETKEESLTGSKRSVRRELKPLYGFRYQMTIRLSGQGHAMLGS